MDKRSGVSLEKMTPQDRKWYTWKDIKITALSTLVLVLFCVSLIFCGRRPSLFDVTDSVFQS